MANVTLPTPVVLAGAGLCLLGGYLVGSVAGATDQVERRTAQVASYDADDQRICLTGATVEDLPGSDDEGRLCGSLRRTPSSAVPREGDTLRFVSVATAEQVDGEPRQSVVVIGDVVR
ncbi:hypothetical protein ASG49_06345 [Marmoricola sp. Leaf446]|uniref:hypothetical protein n=1 Tax=Marmoricola sp. Leaf446 TaxID=1736379 RepID=UPI0006F48C5D|nr:hypothetical protein [Marmoricola sp. Leaf446]KQT94487.1 hypothetical protein ASG49_06345 [Marmoricola sp. Leaf446]